MKIDYTEADIEKLCRILAKRQGYDPDTQVTGTPGGCVTYGPGSMVIVGPIHPLWVAYKRQVWDILSAWNETH